MAAKRFLFLLCVILGVLGLITVQAKAIIISGGTSANNLSAPADDPGWARVGRVGTNGSGVYLGNGWVLTANHVSSKTYFTVEGDTTYNKMDGEQFGVQLKNTSKTAYIDLYMFRVDVSVGNLNGLGDMVITSSAPNNNTQGVHIGTGDGQTSSSETHWYVDTTPNPDVWSTSWFEGADTDRYGYYWSSFRDTRWAYEDVYDNDYDFTVSGVLIEGLATDFVQDTDYGMAADHDSGSGLFVKNGSVWELAGIAHAVGTFSGQPSATGVYGNLTIYSDLSAYSDQIADTIVIPEPVTIWSLAILGMMMVQLGRRIR